MSGCELFEKELFPGSGIIRAYAYKTAARGRSYALLAKQDHIMSALFAGVWGKSAHFRPGRRFRTPLVFMGGKSSTL